MTNETPRRSPEHLASVLRWCRLRDYNTVKDFDLLLDDIEVALKTSVHWAWRGVVVIETVVIIILLAFMSWR